MKYTAKQNNVSYVCRSSARLGVSMVSDWTLLLLVNMFVTIATHYLHHQAITFYCNNCTLQKGLGYLHILITTVAFLLCA